MKREDLSEILIVRHTVSYFPHWKAIFDKHQRHANEYGLKTLYVLRDTANCNQMTIIMAANSPEKAKEFMTSSILKDAMKKAGVLTEPEITYLSDVTSI
jgi:hypothetical protein